MARAFADAVRNLRRARAFTTVVVLTLALGIGATTAMFSVVDAVLINPLAFPNADRVLEVWTYFREGAARTPGATSTVVATLRQESALFEQVSAYQFGSGTLTGDGDPEMLSLAGLSPSIFGMFPAAPIAGRLFNDADATSPARSILISEKFWHRRFGRDPSVLGRALTIDDVPYRVIGILPARFNFPESSVDAWRPIDIDGANVRMRAQLVVLRRAGVSKQVIDDRLNTLTASLLESAALPKGQYLVTDEPIQSRYGRNGASALYLLLGAVAVLLLVACVNVSNLMLVRASSRHGELALMAAIGADRSRLLRDAFVESVLLATAGGAIGLWLAGGLLDLILGLTPPQMLMLSRATGALDGRAVAFALALSLVTCIVFGIVPAWKASRVDPLESLKQQSRSMAGRSDDWWQGAMVSIQVALVVILLAGAGLLLRSFINLNAIDLGFDPDRLAILQMQLTSPRYSAPGAALNLMRDIESRVESQLGIAVTISTGSPIRSRGFADDIHPEAEGLTPPPPPAFVPNSIRISPDFFDVYHIRILDGRSFRPEDGDNAVILNEVMAKRYFPGVSPIGRRFKINTNSPWLTVVGVSGSVRMVGAGDPLGDMEYYIPYPAVPRTYNFISMTAAVGENPDAALSRIKRIAWDLDSSMPVIEAVSLREQFGEAISRPRFVLTLSGAFTICAVLIAAVGVYGVSAYWVTRRRRELAIRMAMGASPDRVVMSVLARSLRLAAIGATAGLSIALGGAQIMKSLLFAVDPRDPITFAGVTILLAVIAVVACVGPALKASRVDPMTTLRAE